MTERVWRWFTGYFRVHRVCTDIALCTGEQDSSYVPWHNVWSGDRAKVKWACSEISGLWSCFQIYSKDRGQQVSLLGADLFFKTALFCSWAALGFHISRTMELDTPAPTKALCLWMDANFCCWGGIQSWGMTSWAILLRFGLLLWAVHSLVGNGGETET